MKNIPTRQASCSPAQAGELLVLHHTLQQKGRFYAAFEVPAL